MGKIEEIFDKKEIFGLQIEAFATPQPLGIIHPVEILDLAGIGFRGVAHPNPDKTIAFDRGIGTYTGIMRNGVLTGDQGAFAMDVEAKAVVGAFDVFADELSLGQLCVTVTAAIFQRHGCAVF